MIALQQLDKTFNKGTANQVSALQNISLTVADQDFVVIIGANGSGKTTLFNIIAGAEFPTQGQIHINGRNVTHVPDYKRSQWIARVFQNPLSGTAPDLTILDNFRLAALRTSSKKLRIGINDKFKNTVRDKIAELGMGLENKLLQPMGTLSGGQRQALTLVMSVMDHTEVLLLDEPTAALDPRSAAVVMTTAQKLIDQYRLTAIFITHNLKDAQHYGNRLLHMQEGKITRDITGPDKQALQLADIYGWFA
ncbi:ABC transporter ATP-binding protein [Chitinophaga defluvii]|uniref:ATP-binding cassette domain-containing protein n=1 Tax=Chitinophaga defluvii TaxID=3163343 RepID=A0ABV2T258_9BACT